MLLRRIDRGGRVVEHQHAGVGEDRPGDGDALALTAGQREAAFAEHRVVRVGQSHDEVVRAGESGGTLDLLGRGLGIGERDVGGHAVVEQQRVLEHDADGMPDVVQRELPDVDAVDRDAAVSDVVEPHEQTGDRRLARPGGPDDRHRLPGLELEVEPPQDRHGRVVAEVDVVEADRADPISTGTVAARQIDRVLGIDDVGMDLQHFVDALESDRRALTPGDRHAEHPQRAHEQGDVEVELDELAEREVAVDHLHAAEAEHGDRGRAAASVRSPAGTSPGSAPP